MVKLSELRPHLKRYRDAREQFELAFEQEQAGEWKNYTDSQLKAIEKELEAISNTINQESLWIEKHTPPHKWPEYLT